MNRDACGSPSSLPAWLGVSKVSEEEARRVDTNDDGQAAGRAVSFPEPDLIAVTDIIRRIRAAATARHVSLGNPL